MKLIELIENLSELSNDLVIYIPSGELISPDSTVTTGSIDELVESGEPMGLKYLIEVELAKDAIRVWQEWRNGKVPNLDEKYQAVAYYIEHDHYLPTDVMK
jgi:hypothetical protein